MDSDMHISSDSSPLQHHVRLDSAGRVVIPADLRRRWQVDQGDTLLITEDSSGVRLQTQAEALRQAQEYFCALAPANESLVDELIAERRKEAARE